MFQNVPNMKSIFLFCGSTIIHVYVKRKKTKSLLLIQFPGNCQLWQRRKYINPPHTCMSQLDFESGFIYKGMSSCLSALCTSWIQRGYEDVSKH